MVTMHKFKHSYVCKENNAKLVIWTTKGWLTIDVPFDEIYWTTIMLPAIRSFFEMHIAPEILTDRLKKSLNSQDNFKDKEKSDSSEDSTNESFSGKFIFCAISLLYLCLNLITVSTHL